MTAPPDMPPIALHAYRHDNALGAAWMVALAGVVFAVLLGVTYGALIVVIPLAGVVTALLVFGFPALLGWSMSQFAKAAHCRSPAFLRALGAGLGAFALYLSWAAFFATLMWQWEDPDPVSIPTMLLHPTLMLDFARALAVDGWYSISDITPRGAAIWAMWGAEALIVVGVTAATSTVAIDDEVYCPGCSCWCDATRDAGRLGVEPGSDALAEVAAGRLEGLSRLPAPDPDNPVFVQLDTWSCPQCRHTGAVRVQLGTISRNAKDEVEVELEPLTPTLLITPDALSDLVPTAAGLPRSST